MLDVDPSSKTVILADPEFAIFAAGTHAVSCVGLTNVVASETPFHVAVAPRTKFEPLTVNVNPGPVDTTGDGERLEMKGAGVTMNWRLLSEVTPFDTTVIGKTFGDVIKELGTMAVSWVLLMVVVTNEVPFQFTVGLKKNTIH